MKPRAVLALLALSSFACSSSVEPATAGGLPPDEVVAEAPGVEASAPEAPVATPALPACEPLAPRATPLEVSVLPEAGATPFVSVLDRAQVSIRVMVYQMGFGPVLDAIVAKAKAGVKVRVILDVAQKSVNQKYMDQLAAAGAEVIWSDPTFRFMHAKVIIVDEAEAVVSTGNYYIKNMLRERNYAVRDADPADVAVLTKIFDADFTRTEPDLSCTRLLVSPTNAKARLLDFIASATKDVLVESMQLGDTDIRDALAARKAAGVNVRVLLADPSWIDANADAATFLAEHAIPARHKDHVHVKAIVVDGKAAYTGSINLSWTSLTQNREVGMLVSEASNVSAMTSTFETDWAAATPF